MAGPALAARDWRHELAKLGLWESKDLANALLGYKVTVAGKEYTLRHVLGSGTYGLAFAAQDASDEWVALKVFLSPTLRSTVVELANAERILRCPAPGIAHRNVVKLFAHSAAAPATPPPREQPPQLPALELPCIVCELCADFTGGVFQRANSLHGVVYTTPFTERFARHFFSEILAGLRYLHSMDICHRDLKTENVFFSNGVLKLGDFGAAKHTPASTAGECTQLFQADTVKGVGTVGYFPPEFFDAYYDRDDDEAIKGKVTYGARAFDVFSVGMILLYMVGVNTFLQSRRVVVDNKLVMENRVVMPFQGEQDFSVLEDAPTDFCGKLDEEAPRFERFWARYPDLSQRLSPECKDLINRCMVKTPLQRITLDDVANHPWMAREPHGGRRGNRGFGGGHETPFPSTEEVSNELRARNVLVDAHPGLVSTPSTGAIGMASLQAAHSMDARAEGGVRYDAEWDERLEVPTDRMFDASTHWLHVRDVAVGQKTMHAAYAFAELSGLLDHVEGVEQHARTDADSGLSLRLTGVYRPPCEPSTEAVEARFAAQVLLLESSTVLSLAAQLERKQPVKVLLQLLPLGDKPGFVDSTEKLAARGVAIQALAETLRARYRTKEAMQNAGNPDEPLGVEELMHNLQSAKVSDEPKAKKRRTETEDDEADAGAARKPASQRSGKRSRSQK